MDAITVMSALAQPTRLTVFSLLARAGADGMTAGDLAEGTGTPATTMSAHLAILTRARLATSTRSGRNIVYRALPDMARELAVFLIRDCCDGSADGFRRLQEDLDECYTTRDARLDAGAARDLD